MGYAECQFGETFATALSIEEDQVTLAGSLTESQKRMDRLESRQYDLKINTKKTKHYEHDDDDVDGEDAHDDGGNGYNDDDDGDGEGEGEGDDEDKDETMMMMR